MSNRTSNLPRILTFQIAITAAGTPEQLACKRRATTIAFVEGGANVKDTITDSGNGFLVAGFQAGDQIVITSTSALNDGTYTIDSVVAGTITLVSNNDLTTETAGAAGTVKILADKPVPDGTDLLIKAKRGNSGDITIGHSSESALNSALGCFVLDAEQSIRLQVSSLSAVWLDTSNSGDIAEVCFEQNSRS